MRFRRLPRYAWLGLIAPAAAGAWLYAAQVSAGSLSNLGAWSPTPTEIAAAVDRDAREADPQERSRVFAELFQKRFRSHQLAIGLRLLPGHHARLMCAAYIPRWYMAKAAISLDEETRSVLHTAYNIDIYETYIGLRRRKLGELRRDPVSRMVRVTFDPPYPIDLSDLSPRERARLALQQSSIIGTLAPSTPGTRPLGPKAELLRHIGFAPTGRPEAAPPVVPHNPLTGLR